VRRGVTTRLTAGKAAIITVMSGGGSVQSYIEDLLFRIPHVHLILVTDKDGVALIKATDDSFTDRVIDYGFSSLFNTASEQAGKLGLGANSHIICRYAALTTVQVAMLPLLVTIVCGHDVNVGLVVNAIPELKAKLEGTRSGVQMHISAEEADKERR